MSYSAFQSVTGPTGPEGIKAVGDTGPSGPTGPTGDTGPNAPYLKQYKWSEIDVSDGKQKAKLTFSDNNYIYIDGVSGQNAYGTGTAEGYNLGNPSGELFKQTTGTDGVTFQFRGLTATDDLTLIVSDTEIAISGSAGVSSGYVESGSTYEFLHLSTRYKAEGGSGSFYGPSGDNGGTGETIQVKFRNAIDYVGDEYNIDFCNNNVTSDGGDDPKEYILDVSQLCRFTPPGGQGKKFGYLCITVGHLNAKDRMVILRTKVNSSAHTAKLKLPLYGASEVNFADPLSGEVLYIAGDTNTGEGYGNTTYRRGIENFNTPYENAEEGYIAGPHPLVWSGTTGSQPFDCPTDQAIIFDTNCSSDEDLDNQAFRGVSFCKEQIPIDGVPGQNQHSYCVRIEEDYFENQNENDPWYGKIRLIVLGGCELSGGNTTIYGFRIGCDAACSCGESPDGKCCTSSVECDTLSTGDITGRVELDISKSNFFKVKAPVQISGITWDYTPRSELSSSNKHAEIKNFTLAIEGGPRNISFPSNVKFAGTPTFTNGIDIVNFLTVDNGQTWLATMAGYGWDVDVFQSENFGSCCEASIGCVNFVSQSYCNNLGGVFAENTACYQRTDDVCGRGTLGACCTGVNPDTLDGSYCPPPGDDSYDPGGNACGLGLPEVGSYEYYIKCLQSQCPTCCDNGQDPQPFPFCDNYNEDICNLPVPGCCVPTINGKYCARVYNACECALLGGFSVESCDQCIVDGNGDPITPVKCCTPCPIGCIDTTDEASCAEIGGTVVDSCSNCTPEGTIDTPNAIPICLPDSNLLECNLINGYFVPNESVSEGQTPCDVCNTINACEPPSLGTCCDRYTGTCYGIMFETACNYPTAEWHAGTEDCDICCPEQEVFGACCLCDDNCVDQVTPQDCASLGGVFMGIDTTCAASNCAVAGACDCECNSYGCCDCPVGHPSRSNCCDAPDSAECCSPGNDCCPAVDPCCDSNDPDCDEDGGGGGNSNPVRQPNHWRPPGGGNFDPPGPGGIDPRSDWGVYSCCFGAGSCATMFIPSRDDESFDPTVFATEKCEGAGGTISEKPCFMSCQHKFVGACCCLYWTLDCPDDNQKITGSNGCNDCTVKDTYITCSNCEFNGNIGGINAPWDGVSGPYKPINPDTYPTVPNDVFSPPGPTGEKRRKDPNSPWITPEGLRIPFGWSDCCKDNGGCKTKPCTLDEKINFIKNFSEFSDPNNCPDSTPTDACTDDDNNYHELAIECGYCEGTTICGTGGRCEPQDNGRGVSYDDIITASERSSCVACQCVPSPPLCAPQGNCEDIVFSSCRFVYNETALTQTDRTLTGANCDPPAQQNPTPNGQPANGNNGTFRNSTINPNQPQSICTQRANEIWGPCFKDRQSDTVTPNPYFPDGSGVGCAGQSFVPQFRNINNNMVAVTSRIGTSYRYGYRPR